MVQNIEVISEYLDDAGNFHSITGVPFELNCSVDYPYPKYPCFTSVTPDSTEYADDPTVPSHVLEIPLSFEREGHIYNAAYWKDLRTGAMHPVSVNQLVFSRTDGDSAWSIVYTSETAPPPPPPDGVQRSSMAGIAAVILLELGFFGAIVWKATK